MTEAVIMSAIAFVGTNIDDIFVNTIFYSTATSRRERIRITAGVFLGITVLFSLSLAAALGVGLLPEKAIPFLGLLPIFLGIKAIFLGDDDDDHSIIAPTPLRVALVTIANGGDNIAAYVPMLAGFTAVQRGTCAAVFAVMTALLCLFGAALSRLPRLGDLVRRHSGWLIPTVYILLGMYIIASGIAG